MQDRTLESIGNFDLGGVSVGYARNDHTGIEYTDLSIVTEDGSFRR